MIEALASAQCMHQNVSQDVKVVVSSNFFFAGFPYLRVIHARRWNRRSRASYIGRPNKLSDQAGCGSLTTFNTSSAVQNSILAAEQLHRFFPIALLFGYRLRWVTPLPICNFRLH
jgi:hypothetical protein